MYVRDAQAPALTISSNVSAPQRLSSSRFGRAQDSASIRSKAVVRDRAGSSPHWTAAARVYGQALTAGLIPGSSPIGSKKRRNGEILSVFLDAENAELTSLNRILAEAYRDLSAGDILLLELDGAARPGQADTPDRDLLARALYRAGFDCPLIWAGSKLLKAETRRRSPLDLVMSQAARGAGPRRLPGVDALLVANPDQLIAMARRSELAPPPDRVWRLSVVMPVYNEQASFRDVMEQLLAKTIPGFDIEICLVESNSTDGTREDVLRYADHPRVRLVLEDKPSGKGHAVRKGLELASGDIVLIQDADREYDLEDYDKLVAPIRRGDVSFVLGSRHPPGDKLWQIRHFAEQRHVSALMNVGHLFFTLLLNVMFSQGLRDPFTMYKVFRRDCIHNVQFTCNRFDFDFELVGKLVRNGFRPVEINVRYQSRSFDEGKKVSFFRDPPTWVRACVKHRFSKLYHWPDQL